MSTPSYINLLTFFYPVGNTPAVCLTQDLPPGEKADILLLGCGDARNILFTAYSQNDSEDRLVDITCCDIEPAILARNILLFTLLLDDDSGSNDSEIWHIYYDTLIDTKSFKLLQSQADKLLALTISNQNWDAGEYGKLLRFCDHGTFAKIKDVWASYTTSSLDKAEKAAYELQFKLHVKKTKSFQKKYTSGINNITGVRSAAPVGVQALTDLNPLYQNYWKFGTTKGSFDEVSKIRHPNPMLANLTNESSTLHYGTDPLLGFYLAAAYVPLALTSPLQPSITHHSMSQLNKVIQTARPQFQLWSKSFKKCAAKQLTLRFLIGDALAFFLMDPLILNGEDYSAEGGAPLSFNVIDTSNLADHVGALNLMVAAPPLLRNSVSATLYTESLAKTEENQKALVNGLLCGHLPTISILLGIFPLEYYTNASAISTVDESVFAALGINKDPGGNVGQMHSGLVWKRTIAASEGVSEVLTYLRVKFEKADLAVLLHQIYQDMFRCSDIKNMFSKMNMSTLQNNSMLKYTRKSYVIFLHLVKKRVNVDWGKVMEELMTLIYQDPIIRMSSCYMQELLLYLHFFGVYSNPQFQQAFPTGSESKNLKDILAWKQIPATMCITVVVPRAKLKVFAKISMENIGSPIVVCTLRPPNTRIVNAFASLHLAFGTITTSGKRDSDDFKVLVEEDKKAWSGNSPLIVSFYVPTLLVFEKDKTSIIGLVIQSTPQSSVTFVPYLGPEMNLCNISLDNEDAVYITKYLPNQSAYPALSDNEISKSAEIEKVMRSVITAKVDRTKQQISQLNSIVHFPLEKVNAGKVDAVATPTFTTFTSLTSSLRFKLFLSMPESTPWTILGGHTASVLAPITDSPRSPHFMYPVLLTNNGPINWNMPYLNLDCLTILDTTKPDKLSWLKSHTFLQFSAREQGIRDPKKALHKDVRINFKESLLNTFMQFSGIQAKNGKMNVFALKDRKQDGIHILIFVSAIRLDMANHTVVLDSTVLPVTNDLLQGMIDSFIKANSNILYISINQEELKLWKAILPAMVERCRTWPHLESCEYQTKCQIPLSLNNGEKLCSCGNGKLPEDFMIGVPMWYQVSKYTVRAAISPSFSVPFVE